MAALLVTLAVMTVLMSVAMPSWRHLMQREREAELIFRGEQYARAVGLFQRKFAGAFPPSIDALHQQRFLRKKYTDPMTEDGQFQVLYQNSATQAGVPGMPGDVSRPGTSGRSGIGEPGPSDGSPIGTLGPQGGIIGVASKSPKRSIRLYNGRNTYNQWQFLYTEVTTQGGQTPAGGQQPGAGRPGGPSIRPGTGSTPVGRPGATPGVGTGGIMRPGGAGGARPFQPQD